MTSRREVLALLAAAVATPAFPQFPAFAQTPADPLANRFGGPFNLTDHTGRAVDEKTYLGKFQLIYFGFTRCTDACPVDVPNLAAALDKIAPHDAEVQPIFVTVDPDDTPARLKDYVGAFHPRLVGLTGSEAQLAAMAKAYRVHRYRVKLQSEHKQPSGTGPNPSGPNLSGPRHFVQAPHFTTLAHGDKPHSPGQRMSIDHGTLTYLMGRDGKFLTMVPHGAGSKRIAEVLLKYVKRG
jgi:protein SCO1